jgi:hypothetical protein
MKRLNALALAVFTSYASAQHINIDVIGPDGKSIGTATIPLTPPKPPDPIPPDPTPPGSFNIYVPFDTTTSLTGKWGDASGTFNNATGGPVPVYDPTEHALKFTVLKDAHGNTAGQYFIRFPTTNSGRIVVQWRQKFSPEMTTGPWKQMVLSEADGADCTSTATSACVGSCRTGELVAQNTNARGFPQWYTDCGTYLPFEEVVGAGTDFKLQNAVTGCLYSTQPANCFVYQYGKWMVFKIVVDLGPKGTIQWPQYGEVVGYKGTHVQMYAGIDGQPLVKTHDYTQDQIAPPNGYGKVWLLPYNPWSAPHPEAYTWVRDLTMSSADVPLPPPVQPPVPPDNDLPVGKFRRIQGFTNTPVDVIPPLYGTSYTVVRVRFVNWGGGATVGDKVCRSADGHGSQSGWLLCADLTNKKWIATNASTVANQEYEPIDKYGAYLADGSPYQGHTYLSAVASGDGRYVTGEATYGYLWAYDLTKTTHGTTLFDDKPLEINPSGGHIGIYGVLTPDPERHGIWASEGTCYCAMGYNSRAIFINDLTGKKTFYENYYAPLYRHEIAIDGDKMLFWWFDQSANHYVLQSRTMPTVGGTDDLKNVIVTGNELLPLANSSTGTLDIGLTKIGDGHWVAWFANFVGANPNNFYHLERQTDGTYAWSVETVTSADGEPLDMDAYVNGVFRIPLVGHRLISTGSWLKAPQEIRLRGM